MKKKIDVEKLIKNIKADKLETPGRKPMRIDIDYTKGNIRDMRREAMDMGAHGASEYFGDHTNGPI